MTPLRSALAVGVCKYRYSVLVLYTVNSVQLYQWYLVYVLKKKYQVYSMYK